MTDGFVCVLQLEGINPTPWTAPEVSVGRRGGRVFPQVHKKAELRTYQEAIKEELATAYTGPVIISPVSIQFYFWRRIETYERTDGKSVRKHRADATNLQKALEDALQGIVIKNDNQVQHVSSTIVEEGDDVEPHITIVVSDESSVEMGRNAGELHRGRQG